MSNLNPVRTPCIGVCSTGIGDAVCRGCKRFTHEVIDWNGYSQAQKQAIDARLDRFLAMCVGNKLRIVDQKLLDWQLSVQKIRPSAASRPVLPLVSLCSRRVRIKLALPNNMDSKFYQAVGGSHWRPCEIRSTKNFGCSPRRNFDRYIATADLFADEAVQGAPR